MKQHTLQELIQKVVAAGAKFPNKWDVKTHYIDLVEEVGELGNAILVKSGDKTGKRQRAEFEDSLADILFELIMLADEAEVDLEQVLLQMIEELSERQDRGDYED